MAVYFFLMLLSGAPAAEPVIARDIHARPVPLWETTKGLVDDRPAPLGYALPRDEGMDPRLDYDLGEFGDWEERERHEVAFEEAIDMARQARRELELDSPD